MALIRIRNELPVNGKSHGLFQVAIHKYGEIKTAVIIAGNIKMGLYFEK